MEDEAMINELMEFLQTIGDDVLKEVKGKLRANGSFATGRLFNKISIDAYNYKNSKIGLKTTMPYYGRWIDAGRKPTIFPAMKGTPTLLESIKHWCKIKGLPESWAYGITHKIHHKGYKAKPFLQPIRDMNKKLKPFMERYGELFVATLIKEFKK